MPRGTRAYTLTVDDGGGRRVLRSADPVAEAPLRALRDFVAAHGTPDAPGPRSR